MSLDIVAARHTRTKRKYVYLWGKYSLEEKQYPEKRKLFKEKLSDQNQLRELTTSISIEPGTTLGPGNSQLPTPVGKPSPTSRELIDNAMIKNKPRTDNNNYQSSRSGILKQLCFI